MAILKGMCGMYLIHDVSELVLDLLLSALEPLPQIVAYTTPLQQHLQGLLLAPDLNDPADVLGGPAQQRSLQDAVRGLGVFSVEQGEVDVAL